MESFKDTVLEQYQAVKQLFRQPRMLTFSVLNLGMIVFSALMMWKALMVVTKSDSPVVVVLSGSMEPAFQRGDILFLDNTVPDFKVGDITVFKIAGRDVPIVHRVLFRHERANSTAADGGVDYLTKGDNNDMNDRGLYAPGQLWLKRADIAGKAVASVPYLGMVTILLNDYPALKWVLIGLMGVFVLTTREG